MNLKLTEFRKFTKILKNLRRVCVFIIEKILKNMTLLTHLCELGNMADKFDNHETPKLRLRQCSFIKLWRCAEIFARYAWNIFATRTTQGAV